MSFEDEMCRFEAEIRGTQHRMAAAALAGATAAIRNAMGGAMGGPMGGAIGGAMGGGPFGASAHPPPQPQQQPQQQQQRQPQQPHTVSAAPAVISAPPQGGSAQRGRREEAEDDDEDIFAKLAKYESQHKKEKKLKKKSKTNLTPSPLSATPSATTSKPPSVAPPPAKVPAPAPPAPPAFTPVSVATKNTPVSATIGDDALKKAKRQRRMIRTGGGQMWEDESLKEWDPSDFRLFCGDLGNDVTDEVLARTFGRYPSFQKAKVVRDKRTNKTKGYGFVSFKDPMDFTKAVREINGKYVGSRPIKLRKSNWKDRNIDVVRQKQKIKQQMGYKW